MERKKFIRWFNEFGIDDVKFVGGKNASLGEMYRRLSLQGIRVPNGFAVLADAYIQLLQTNGLDKKIPKILKDLNTQDIENLQQRGLTIRQAILNCKIPKDLEIEILEAYHQLSSENKKLTDVAVRSSATAEDLPDASFAGQQETCTIAAAFYPNDVIVRMSDFKTNEYADLIGGKPFEPHEENPMLGFRGASRYYDDRYKEGFALECRAMKKVRDDMGLTNVKLMIPFCRTVDEGKKVITEMEKNGLKRGEHGLEIYVMCEIPSNVILANQFSQIFDGFSIGSNDLTQLVLGVDRDSEIVSAIFDERNEAVKQMIALVIKVAHEKGRKIGICGQAPSDYPEFAKFLVERGIDSISLNPDVAIKTTLDILKMEDSLASEQFL